MSRRFGGLAYLLSLGAGCAAEIARLVTASNRNDWSLWTIAFGLGSRWVLSGNGVSL